MVPAIIIIILTLIVFLLLRRVQTPTMDRIGVAVGAAGAIAAILVFIFPAASSAPTLPSNGSTSDRGNGIEIYDVSGEWDFEAYISRKILSDATIVQTNERRSAMLRVSQESNRITGEYIQASGNGCDQATIEGIIEGNQIKWRTTFYGSCCPGAQVNYEGEVFTEGGELSIKGKITPVGVPPSGCELGFAETTGRKR